MKTLLLAICLVVLSSGCSSRQVIEGGNKVTKAGVSVWANWIKDKGKKYDIELVIQNETDQAVIVMLREMRCKKGAASGELKHTFYNTGERTIDFQAGELKQFRLVCRLGQESKGDYVVTIGNVYANPGRDGSTTGKVIASGVEWRTPQAP